LLWIAVALLGGSTFENRVILLIARGWMRFATFIGNINSKILLSVIFYLIMTPLAIAYRLTHKRSVDHFTHDTKKSYFDDIQPVCGKETFEKVW